MNWNPAFALVLFAVTIITFFGGLLIDKRKKKALSWMFALLACLPLFVFKYYNFINTSLTQGLSQIGLHFTFSGLNWAIPVGISFFTFQAVGYFLDVYHGNIKAEKRFLDYILFVSFFPQVTSGPISKADELLPQIKNPHKFDYEQVKQGLKYLLWGMFIKLVIADRLGLFVDTVYANYLYYSGSTCLIACFFYSLQIYCDFAGYSFMAVGIARTLGFNLINNFKRPYLAISVSEFWKRWHISLTRWLTQNIYIPLGGSRCSKARCYLNILFTFLISGIWHGANWTFIFWGLIHAVLLVIEKSLNLHMYNGNNNLIKSVRICVTFLLVSFAWVFFKMPNISDAFNIIAKIFSEFGIPNLSDFGISSMIILVIGIFCLFFKDFHDEVSFVNLSFLNKKLVRWCVYVGIFCMILIFGMLDGGQFIYVNF